MSEVPLHAGTFQLATNKPCPRFRVVGCDSLGAIPGVKAFLGPVSRVRCPPRQESRVERLKAKREPRLTQVTVDDGKEDRKFGAKAASHLDHPHHSTP